MCQEILTGLLEINLKLQESEKQKDDDTRIEKDYWIENPEQRIEIPKTQCRCINLHYGGIPDDRVTKFGNKNYCDLLIIT